MAKKFGKFLLFVTSTCAIAAGVYYYLQKKESEDFDDEDFDDFDDEEDEDEDVDDPEYDIDAKERTYVPLNIKPAANEQETAQPVTQQEEIDASKEETSTVTEEFFDEEDEFVDDSEGDSSDMEE